MTGQEKKYIDIIDTIVMALDEKERITFMNKTGYQLLGYAEGKLVGKNWFNTFVPETIKAEVLEVYHKLLEGDIDRGRYYENPIITKSGEKKVIYWHNSILNDDEGKIIGVLSSGEDITERKENEFKLIKAEQAIEASSNPMIMVNLNHVLEYVNPAWLKMWGYDHPDEVIGKDMRDFIQEKSLNGFDSRFKQLTCNGRSEGELFGKKKDGGSFHVKCTSSTIFDNQNKPVQRVADFVDITERIKSEKLRMGFNHQLEDQVAQKTLELSTEISDRKIVEEKLKNVQIKMENQIKQLHCLYGVSQILSIPKVTIKELLQSTLYLIPPPLTFPTLTKVRITYERNEYHLDPFQETKWKCTIIKRINGKLLVIDVFYTQDKEFLYEEENLLDEIGERLKIGILRLELDQEKNILAEMVKNAPDAIFALDGDTIITSWNRGAEEIYGYTSQEVIGKPISLLVSPENRDDIVEVVNLIRPGYQISHFETKGVHKSGRLLDISLTVSPVKNSEGNVIAAFSIARDFTEKNQQQQLFQDRLLKSSQFKSEFMASMSHELRTPLNSIIGFTDVVLERISGDINAEQDKFLTNVKSSALLLLDLINDVLDIAKIESGKVALKIIDVPLNQIIEQIHTMVKPIYQKKGLTFEIPTISKETVIQVDRLRFKEILFNLLSNAVKYTQEGSVKLEFSEGDSYWNFAVIDTGIGIKKEDFELIFQDFKRIPSAYVSSIEGTGLGLSLTKRLIEYHGGNISFTSIFGQGSTFTFTIPKQTLIDNPNA